MDITTAMIRVAIDRVLGDIPATERGITICGPDSGFKEAIAKVIELEEICQPGSVDFDNHIEEWKGSGKRKMPKLK